MFWEVTLDTNLSFQPDATDTTTKANRIVYLLPKLKKYMNVEDSLKAHKILIRPILEYCSKPRCHTKGHRNN